MEKRRAAKTGSGVRAHERDDRNAEISMLEWPAANTGTLALSALLSRRASALDLRSRALGGDAPLRALRGCCADGGAGRVNDQDLARAVYRFLRDGGSGFRRDICDALGIEFADIDRAARASGGHILNRFGVMGIKRQQEAILDAQK